MLTFKELGIQNDYIKGLNELGIKSPTEIQQKTIPVLLNSKTDFIGLAHTGTGKTAAFGLPVLHSIDPHSKEIQALILAPTRELVQQIKKQLFKFTKYLDTKIFIEAVYGGEKDSIWLHNGLSELGREVVSEMNKYGIMVDISHPSKEAIKQMISLSKAPVIASHSSARALCDHSRNLDDELLKMIKENGGVVQTVALGAYVNAEKSNVNENANKELYHTIAKELNTEFLEWDEYSKLSEEEQDVYFDLYQKILKIAATRNKEINEKYPPVNVADFVDHIDYMVKLIGIEHVGISSDFDGGGGIEGWKDASETFNVTLELVKRGYT